MNVPTTTSKGQSYGDYSVTQKPLRMSLFSDRDIVQLNDTSDLESDLNVFKLTQGETISISTWFSYVEFEIYAARHILQGEKIIGKIIDDLANRETRLWFYNLKVVIVALDWPETEPSDDVVIKAIEHFLIAYDARLDRERAVAVTNTSTGSGDVDVTLTSNKATTQPARAYGLIDAFTPPVRPAFTDDDVKQSSDAIAIETNAMITKHAGSRDVVLSNSFSLVEDEIDGRHILQGGRIVGTLIYAYDVDATTAYLPYAGRHGLVIDVDISGGDLAVETGIANYLSDNKQPDYDVSMAARALCVSSAFKGCVVREPGDYDFDYDHQSKHYNSDLIMFSEWFDYLDHLTIQARHIIKNRTVIGVILYYPTKDRENMSVYLPDMQPFPGRPGRTYDAGVVIEPVPMVDDDTLRAAISDFIDNPIEPLSLLNEIPHIGRTAPVTDIVIIDDDGDSTLTCSAPAVDVDVEYKNQDNLPTPADYREFFIHYAAGSGSFIRRLVKQRMPLSSAADIDDMVSDVVERAISYDVIANHNPSKSSFTGLIFTIIRSITANRTGRVKRDPVMGLRNNGISVEPVSSVGDSASDLAPLENILASQSSDRSNVVERAADNAAGIVQWIDRQPLVNTRARNLRPLVNLLAAGYSNREIATRLRVTNSTVHNWIAYIKSNCSEFAV